MNINRRFHLLECLQLGNYSPDEGIKSGASNAKLPTMGGGKAISDARRYSL